MFKRENLRLGDLHLDGDTQSRTSISPDVVDDYAELLANGVELPPIDVFNDEGHYWPSDGFHRIRAYQKLGQEWIPCIVHKVSAAARR